MMKMLTVEEVKALVEEMEREEKKTKKVYPYYKRKGKMIKRSYPDYVYTPRYKELFFDPEEKLLRGERGKIFKCETCGKMFGYFDIEWWACDDEELICSCCYEEMMGEDL